jgi:hypothetical protein
MTVSSSMESASAVGLLAMTEGVRGVKRRDRGNMEVGSGRGEKPIKWLQITHLD